MRTIKLFFILIFASFSLQAATHDSIMINKSNYQMYLDLSRQYYKEYRYKQALNLLEQLYRYDSTNIQITNQLGELYVGLNSKKNALFYLGKTLRQDSLNLFALIASGDIYLRNGDPGVAQAYYFQVINYVDSDNYYAYKQIANSYYGMGYEMYGFALEFYNKAVNCNPYDIASFSRIGNIYNVFDQYRLADSICTVGLKNDTLNSSLLNIKAYALYNMKIYSEAAANFDLVLQKGDTIPFNLKYSGLSYFNMNNYPKARFFLERCIVYDSTDFDPYIVLGQLCLQMDDWERGLIYLNKAEKLHYPPPHKSAEIFKTMAGIYNEQKDWNKAIECFQQAYKMNPNDKTLICKLAYQYDFLKQKDKAIALYTQLIATADSSIYVEEVKLAKSRLKRLQTNK